MEHTEIDATKVLIADDHPLILAGVRRALERDERIEVVGEARSAPELLALVHRRAPDLVLMDLRMPGAIGTDCIEAITTKWPDVRVVILSACDDRATIDAALAAGASSYVLKSLDSTDLASIIRQAASGVVFHARLSGGGAAAVQTGPHHSTLTEREQRILEAIVCGQTTAAISRELWISEHTVKFHLTNIYRKLGVANRASAIRHALQHGLVAA
jgi:DNA-binding NarL/FixJ family response regulator